jgi:DNA modification methylase
MYLSELKPLQKNPFKSRGDKQIAAIGRSIQEFEKMMEIRKIVIDEECNILGGNKRYFALKALGRVEIPDSWVDQVSGLTEAQKREFIVKDNAHWGSEWDMDILNDWGVDIEDWGVEVDWEPDKPEASEDDYEMPEEIVTDIVVGDLFEIGVHRLLCGDSTDKEQVERLMGGEKAELLFTSPPYSDMRDYEGGKNLEVGNLIQFIPTWKPFANYQVINLGIQRKNEEVIQYWDDYIVKAKESGYKLLSWNVWDKDMAGSVSNQNAMFSIIHEWIFVFGINVKDLNRTYKNDIEGNAKRRRYNVKNKDGKELRLIRQKDGTTKNSTKGESFKFKQMATVHPIIPELSRTINHPARFPVELPSEYIKAMTNENDIVTDSFLGSGTTMVAAHQLNRKCYGMELEPKYCQVIIDRMRKLDPGLVIKKNGEVMEFTVN